MSLNGRFLLVSRIGPHPRQNLTLYILLCCISFLFIHSEWFFYSKVPHRWWLLEELSGMLRYSPPRENYTGKMWKESMFERLFSRMTCNSVNLRVLFFILKQMRILCWNLIWQYYNQGLTGWLRPPCDSTKI